MTDSDNDEPRQLEEGNLNEDDIVSYLILLM